jgi:hydrogenase maturation protease
MGNPILADDGLGVRLARDCLQLVGDRETVEVVVECSQGGLNLLDVVSGHDRLVVFDSIKTPGGKPGTWFRFPATALNRTLNLGSVHDANFATALALGRCLGHLLPSPEQIWIFAVEVADNLTFSESFSPSLEAAYPQCRDEILAEVLALLDDDPRDRSQAGQRHGKPSAVPGRGSSDGASAPPGPRHSGTGPGRG